MTTVGKRVYMTKINKNNNETFISTLKHSISTTIGGNIAYNIILIIFIQMRKYEDNRKIGPLKSINKYVLNKFKRYQQLGLHFLCVLKIFKSHTEFSKNNNNRYNEQNERKTILNSYKNHDWY